MRPAAKSGWLTPKPSVTAGLMDAKRTVEGQTLALYRMLSREA
jgi:hypothetical protein